MIADPSFDLEEASSSSPSNTTTTIFEELEAGRSAGRATVLDRSKLMFDASSQIGQSRFGTLFRAQLLDDATPPNTTVVTARRLVPARGDQHANRQHVEMVNKADRWSNLNNPNIVKFVGYYPSGPAVSREFLLVFTHVPGVHLAEYLERDSPDYTRRITLRNILVDSNGRALLCDYDLEGLAGEVTGASSPMMETLRYKSPEELGRTPNPVLRSDVWSFGNVFLTIITDQVPYGNTANDEPKLVEVTSQRILPADIDNLDCPARAQNLLGVCWKWEPESRPTPSELVSVLSGRLCRFTEAWSIPADGLSCLRFSRDGEHLVVGYEGLIKVFQADSGRLLFTLPMPRATSRWLQTSRSGQFLVASTKDDNIMLWDLKTRELKGEFKGHKDEIWALDIPFDDSCVVSGSYDKTLRVWSMDGRESPLQTFRTEPDTACLTTHPSSHIVAVALYDGDVQVRSIRTGQVLATLDRPNNVWTLRFSPDGRSLYGGCRGGAICCWDVGDLLQSSSEDPHADGPVKRTARQFKSVNV
ncbi:hypothetical protein FRB99_003057 [Tulasnella sp. 403]|nr:hypothetical protein FRB99_003057 [Tulasnella sp. 403]